MHAKRWADELVAVGEWYENWATGAIRRGRWLWPVATLPFALVGTSALSVGIMLLALPVVVAESVALARRQRVHR
jgi:hypothetical protein